MSRLTSTYMLCVALAGLALAGCSEDEGTPQDPVDARPERIAACVLADCQRLPAPSTRCANGQPPMFSCERNSFSARCEWANPVCSSPTDGGSPDGPTTEAGDVDGDGDASPEAGAADGSDEDAPAEAG